MIIFFFRTIPGLYSNLNLIKKSETIKVTTTRIDISAGSVPAGPNLTNRMDPGMNKNIYTEYMKSKFNFLKVIFKMHFSARYVFHGGHVLDSFNMVISAIIKIWIANMPGLKKRNIILFTVLKKKNFK